ncbi:MAG: hypothetical protein HY473_00475, partial [Candidatus Sungbacteria bacterium]|nr:hypothetical protein [Candidatus Sungbacteria bacterium]
MDYRHEDLISLREASRISRYSQEYLSLRVRQGKLRAEKVDGVWCTTKDWLKAYLRAVAAVKASSAVPAQRAVVRGRVVDLRMYSLLERLVTTQEELAKTQRELAETQRQMLEFLRAKEVREPEAKPGV